MAAGPPVPIIRMSCSITGHFHSPFSVCVLLLQPEKKMLAFPLPLHSFVSVVEDRMEMCPLLVMMEMGGPLLRGFSGILHLFAGCGFGVSIQRWKI